MIVALFGYPAYGRTWQLKLWLQHLVPVPSCVQFCCSISLQVQAPQLAAQSLVAMARQLPNIEETCAAPRTDPQLHGQVP